MSTVAFTQFLRPDGRRSEVTADVSEAAAALADVMKTLGCKFEIEVLTTGEVSMEIVSGDDNDPDGPHSLAIDIVPNGPDVPPAVEKLIATAHKRLADLVTGAGEDNG